MLAVLNVNAFFMCLFLFFCYYFLPVSLNSASCQSEHKIRHDSERTLEEEESFMLLASPSGEALYLFMLFMLTLQTSIQYSTVVYFHFSGISVSVITVCLLKYFSPCFGFVIGIERLVGHKQGLKLGPPVAPLCLVI